MLAGLGALKSKIKIVSKLETDCDQTKGAAAAQTILTANQNLTAIYSACGPPVLGAIQSVKNAGHQAGWNHPGRLRRAAARDQRRSRQEPRTPPWLSSRPRSARSGLQLLYNAVNGKAVTKNVDTGTAIVTKANAKKFG